MTDLKPCPFCGGEAYADGDASHSHGYVVGCNAEMCIQPDTWDVTRDEAKDAWNTRNTYPLTYKEITKRLSDRSAMAVAKRTELTYPTVLNAKRGGRKPHAKTLEILSDYLTKNP